MNLRSRVALKNTKAFLIILFSISPFGFSTLASAQEATPKTPPGTEANQEEESLLKKTNQTVQDAATKVNAALLETRARRAEANYYGLLNYSPLDLIVPGKYGVSFGIINSPESNWELEYLHGSVSVPFLVEDLGSIDDDRYSLIRRSYAGRNSFNLSYGLSFFDFNLHLGNKVLSRLSGNSYPSVDLIKIQSLGFNFAIGNRWTFKHNITFGVDWVSWAQPLVITKKSDAFLNYATNEEDKDDVKKAIDVAAYFPRFAFLKLQLGILF